ncbi:hypothetical protein C2845_PM06G26360 [Panicum miliaceum]|uniref:Uncharacterized protein n=1 Tax=Panicum miliaceum TaxID=4540 RepID=A0A3L6R8X1_PANMI|nr:hypothetical protein C2845_PM06G26360 [Panicum miliaceum]
MSPPRTEDPMASILAKLEENVKKDEESRLAQASSKEKGIREPGRRNTRTIKPNPRYIGEQWVDI